MGKVRFPGTNMGSSSCLKYLVMSATRSLLSASRKRELLPPERNLQEQHCQGLTSCQQTAQLLRTFALSEEEEMRGRDGGFTL